MKSYTFYILLLLLFVSCTAPIDINTDNSEPVIVIYGILTDELKCQEVHISSSSPYFDKQPNSPISGAEVTIKSSENATYSLLENNSLPGIYQTTDQWKATAGTTYYLTVSVDFDHDGNKEIYDAETTILSFNGLDSTVINPVNTMGVTLYALNAYGKDDPEHDYYLSKYLVNDTMKTGKISELDVMDDEIFNGQYVNGQTMRYFHNVDDMSKYSSADRKNMTFLKSGDVVSMQMCKIPEKYYNFISQCKKEMNGENPIFGGPASNITTNISNGGVGFFSGYCITSTSAVVP